MMYRTAAFQGYSLRFSPFEPDKVAVAGSQNYGIIGNGRQFVLQVRAVDFVDILPQKATPV